MTEIKEATDHDLALARDFSRLIAGFLGADSNQVWSRLQKEFYEPGSTVAEARLKRRLKSQRFIKRPKATFLTSPLIIAGDGGDR
jgi:hypothetical protein